MSAATTAALTAGGCAALVAASLALAARARRAAGVAAVGRRLGPRGPVNHRAAPVGALAPAVPPPVLRALDAAGIDGEKAVAAWRGWALSGPVLLAVAVLTGGPLLAAPALVAIVAVPLAALRALRGRGARRAEAALPGLVEEVARRLRTGSSVPQALAGAAAADHGPLAAELAEVVAAVEQGGSLADELDRWAGRRPLDGVRLAVAALTLGATTGGPQARALDAVAATLRDRQAVRREASALAAQARASAVVMGATPLVFAVVATAADPRVGHVLVGTPAGVACLAGGVALDAVAAVWMLHITEFDG